MGGIVSHYKDYEVFLDQVVEAPLHCRLVVLSLPAQIHQKTNAKQELWLIVQHP